MLKPTERPPASFAPRFAASITPGPPPVTTAQPCAANKRPASRARSYTGSPSRMRAEPKMVTAGRSIDSTASNPARNSSAIMATWRSSSAAVSLLGKIRLSSTSEPGLRNVRRDHAEDEKGREQTVEDADLEGAPPAATRNGDRVGAPDRELLSGRRSDRVARHADRAPDGAAVQDSHGNEVDEVDEEADVRERAEQVRVDGFADSPED